jgi:hypothetical protein
VIVFFYFFLFYKIRYFLFLFFLVTRIFLDADSFMFLVNFLLISFF